MTTLALPLAWQNKINQYAEIRTKINIDAIHAVGERSRIFSQMSNDISDTRRKMYEDAQRSNDKRAEAFSQSQRDVTPYDTGDGRKVELPSAYGHAWRGTDGQYIVSNDPLYNPNSDPNNIHATWTELQQAKP